MRHLVIAFAAAALIAPTARAEKPLDLIWGAHESDEFKVWGGAIKPQASPLKSDYGFALGVGWERRRQSGLRYGFEFNYYGSDYQAPGGLSCGSFCTVQSRMDLDVFDLGTTLGYGVRYGSMDLYAGAGLGWYRAKMTAHTVTFGLLPAELTKSDSGIGPDLRAGIGFHFGRDGTLGVEYRRLWLDGNFGVLSRGADMPIGGGMLLLSLGKRL